MWVAGKTVRSLVNTCHIPDCIRGELLIIKALYFMLFSFSDKCHLDRYVRVSTRLLSCGGNCDNTTSCCSSFHFRVII